MDRHSVGPGHSLSELIERLDTGGVVCLEELLPAGWLETTRADVLERVAEHGDHDVFVFGPHDADSTAARTLVDHTGLRGLMDELITTRWPHAKPEPDVASCLRVLTCGSTRDDPLMLHYDAKIVTIVVPIFLPDGPPGQSGELVAIANKRPFRRLVASHVIDKMRTRNRRYRNRIVESIRRAPGDYVVDMQPGNAYMFWGYRTLHGNLPCAHGQLRATLVLQYGEPHPHSTLMRFVRRQRARRLSRWMDANSAHGTRDALAS